MEEGKEDDVLSSSSSIRSWATSLLRVRLLDELLEPLLELIKIDSEVGEAIGLNNRW